MDARAMATLRMVLSENSPDEVALLHAEILRSQVENQRLRAEIAQGLQEIDLLMETNYQLTSRRLLAETAEDTRLTHTSEAAMTVLSRARRDIRVYWQTHGDNVPALKAAYNAMCDAEVIMDSRETVDGD